MTEPEELSKPVTIKGCSDGVVYWSYPNIGTCGDEVTKLSLVVWRVRAIPDLVIGFDGTRDGFTIGKWVAGVFQEIVFIAESQLE